MYFSERENLRTKSDLKAKFESRGHSLVNNVVEQGEEEEGLDQLIFLIIDEVLEFFFDCYLTNYFNESFIMSLTEILSL